MIYEDGDGTERLVHCRRCQNVTRTATDRCHICGAAGVTLTLTDPPPKCWRCAHDEHGWCFVYVKSDGRYVPCACCGRRMEEVPL
jgi:hypothetical protein